MFLAAYSLFLDTCISISGVCLGCGASLKICRATLKGNIELFFFKICRATLKGNIELFVFAGNIEGQH